MMKSTISESDDRCFVREIRDADGRNAAARWNIATTMMPATTARTAAIGTLYGCQEERGCNGLP